MSGIDPESTDQAAYPVTTESANMRTQLREDILVNCAIIGPASSLNRSFILGHDEQSSTRARGSAVDSMG